MTELPAGWRLAALDDLVSPLPGSITDGPFGSNLTSAHYTSEGARVIRLQNIGDGVFNDAKAFVSTSHFEALRKHEAREGDLIIASLGDVLPRSCLVPAGIGPAIVKADCIRVRLADHADPRYVLYALQRPDVRRWADDHRHGVGRPRLGLKVIRQLPVPLAPLEEQRRIVDVLEDHLSRLDAAVAGLDRAQRMADRLRQRAMAAAVAQAGGEVRPLKEWLEASIGGIWGSEAGDDEVPVRVLRVTELKAWGRIAPETAARRSCTPSQFANRRLGSGDLLLEKSGGGPTTPVGRVGLVPPLSEDSVCSNFMQLLRPDRRFVVPEFLHAALNVVHFRGVTASMQTASTNIRNIKASEYLRLPVAVPSIAVQETAVARVAQVADGTEAFRQSTQVAARRGAALRRALLQAAFSGRLVPGVSPETSLEGGAR